MCQVVLMAYVMVASAARMPPVSDGRQVLMLQGDLDGATVAGVVAFFAAMWGVRAVLEGYCSRRARRFVATHSDLSPVPLVGVVRAHPAETRQTCDESTRARSSTRLCHLQVRRRLSRTGRT